MIAAPRRALPELIASSSIACVKPQGKNTVAAPRIAGVNADWLFACLRMRRVTDRGGCRTTKRKIGWTFSRWSAVAIMNTAVTTMMVPRSVIDGSIKEPSQPSNAPSAV